MKTTAVDPWPVTIWHDLALGQPLPIVPLWLSETLFISVELEATYEESCRSLRIP